MSEPSLPYAGTSGHSGTDTSRQRAVEADTSGLTNERQAWVVRRLDLIEKHAGITVKDLREKTDWHHGVASSVLTTLHIAGRITRLEEKRDRCHVYVLPEYVNGRPESPHTPNKRNRSDEEAYARGYEAGLLAPASEWMKGRDSAEAMVARIDAYLADREAVPTEVAWVDDLRKIMNGENDG